MLRRLAMSRALQDAALEPQQICHLNAHAASTPLGDTAEMDAIAEVRSLLALQQQQQQQQQQCTR